MDTDRGQSAILNVRVEPASDAGIESDLTAFSIGTRHIRIRQIVDRWFAADHGYIKVLGDDDALYILRYDERSGRWEMTLFQAM